MSANLASPTSDISLHDNIAIQLVWTGSPTGTFSVNGSLDKNTWIAIPLPNPVLASGSGGNALLDLNQLSFPYIQVTYIAGSGSGSLDMWISGKGI